jgi:segregation and condensation protein A
MQVRLVPWWRKALDFALSGIRSGFGLFAKTQKHADEIEPETIAGYKDIREEAELIEHSPEQDHIVEAVNQVETAVAPEAEMIAAPEVTALADADEINALPEVAALQEAEVVVETLAAEPAPEAQLQVEPEMETEAASEPEPEVEGETVLLEEAGAPEPGREAESVTEPEPIEPMIAEVAIVPEADAPAEAPGVDAVEEPAETPEMTVEAAAPIADPEPETAVQETLAVQEAFIDASVENPAEQVTEQQVTFENEPVDEVLPQVEAAISEDLAPEPASPVLDEMVEPAAQAGDEPVQADMATESQTDQNVDAIVENTPEEIGEQTSETPVEQVAEQFVVDEQSMELNHSNSEPAEEQVEAVEAAVPVVVNEPVNAPEAGTGDPEAADDPAAPAAVAQHPSKPFIKLEAKEGEANPSPFSIIVSDVYDGPLDLLLDLIRKQDIDIYDIPIARITAQFLAYVNQLKASDVDVAGEFIYTASLLIHIKSKMLLPRAPSGPEDAAEDPRRELVERLLEHERFKNAAQMLQQKQMLEAATVTNPGVRDFKEDAGAEPEIAADTVDLVRVFRDILERARNRPILNVEEDSVTVGQMIQFLARRLTMEDKPVALRKLLSHSRSERALIAMFLALLELVRLQAILLRQDVAFSEIFIKKHSNFESVINEGAAADDWK